MATDLRSNQNIQYSTIKSSVTRTGTVFPAMLAETYPSFPCNRDFAPSTT